MSAAGGPAAPSRAGWPHQDSPFHDGERQAQERAGVADKIESVGRRVIRTFMPEDHRELFGKLPLLFLGVVDDLGQPWASVASGAPGFVRTPDERTLHVSARLHAADPPSRPMPVTVDSSHCSSQTSGTSDCRKNTARDVSRPSAT